MSPTFHLTELENGARLATAEMPWMSSVSLGVWVGVGSRDEPPEINGICHFIEHLLFKGTRKRSAREISEAVEGIGGSFNAFTSEEMTCFHARASREHFDDLADVLLDMLFNSVLKPEDIHKERAVIKEEIAMYLDEPQHHVQELLNGVLWPDNPLGRPITGTPETLDAIARPDLRRFLRTRYVGRRTVIVAAGNVRHRSAVQTLRKRLRNFPAGNCRQTIGMSKQATNCRQGVLCTRDIEQTQMAVGFETFSRHDLRRYALRLLNVALGENMSSRLFQIIREDSGLAYSIYSSPGFFDDTGDLVISAGLETEKIGRALKLLLSELRRFREQLLSPRELARARDYVIGQMDLAAESAETQMNWLGEQLLGYGRIFTSAEIKAKLRRVTPSQIRAVAESIFTRERARFALVSPLKQDREFARILRAGLP